MTACDHQFMRIRLKKPLACILVMMILLSGCGISRLPSTGTDLTTSKIESSPTGSAQTTPATTFETTQKNTGAETSTIPNPQKPETEYSITLKRDILVLMIAYPGFVTGVEQIDGLVFLIMKSGRRILYDDEKTKSFEKKLSNADIQDMLENEYPLTEIKSLMDPDVDPGRIRNYELFGEIYGNTKDAIMKKLISVGFGDQHLPFNQEAGAAAALAAAAGEAATLAAAQPHIAEYLYPSSGTFNFRVIAGTSRLSPHAYGMAIDLKSSPDGYWRWASPEAGEKLLKKYPQEIVLIFEQYGFIWGGKWNHFDLFHFEYRPELLLKATLFPGKIDWSKPWYQGANLEDESVKRNIELIDKTIG
jgi:hypothetical protein